MINFIELSPPSYGSGDFGRKSKLQSLIQNTLFKFLDCGLPIISSHRKYSIVIACYYVRSFTIVETCIFAGFLILLYLIFNILPPESDMWHFWLFVR